ncbi:MAG: helix-turn-helix domain-containing protein [Lachnospiraceae bacterium]|nr:helix-turn-helix domain-containing protein [Lachnospiraceae bacterium]
MSFAENLTELRKYHNFSQEELAEMIGVSRQTLSKYETGESLPDIEKCKLLADVFSVSVDDLISYQRDQAENMGLGIPPRGKHIFGMVKVGDKGQIVIPAKARKIFDIQAGDNLIVLGDEGQGIAIIKEKGLLNLLGNLHSKR